jgi:Co/Zn/Cd efflux system component
MAYARSYRLTDERGIEGNGSLMLRTWDFSHSPLGRKQCIAGLSVVHGGYATPAIEACRHMLWAVVAINLGMFVVQTTAGTIVGSAALGASALDFLGDAANFTISLTVAGMADRYRALAALARATSMAGFGAWVLGTAVWQIWGGSGQDALPHAATIGIAGLAALLANVVSFGLLWGFRCADVNMRSAWIGKRNDVLGALAVLLAAAGVFGSGTIWPDLLVALILAALALQGSATIVRQSIAELWPSPAVAVP